MRVEVEVCGWCMTCPKGPLGCRPCPSWDRAILETPLAQEVSLSPLPGATSPSPRLGLDSGTYNRQLVGKVFLLQGGLVPFDLSPSSLRH